MIGVSHPFMYTEQGHALPTGIRRSLSQGEVDFMELLRAPLNNADLRD
jgi:hypothetical protein